MEKIKKYRKLKVKNQAFFVTLQLTYVDYAYFE